MAALTTLQPKELLNFKRFDSNTSLSEVEIPEAATNRKKTDKYFLYIFIAFIIILMPFLIYTFYYSDIDRLTGYDDCGNVCGKKNIKYAEWSCTGKDMTDLKYFYSGQCHATSAKPRNDYNPYGDSYGFDEDTITDRKIAEDILSYLGKVGWKIALASFICLGLCAGMIMLFRYAMAFVVWGIILLSWTVLFVYAMFLWTFAVQDSNGSSVVEACIVSIIVFGLLCMIIFIHKRIRLVIMLFTESTKAVFDMPSLFVVPTVTVIGLIIILAIYSVTATYISSAGILTEIYSSRLRYSLNPVMIFTAIFNVIIALWGMQFVIGIQHMVIGGAISKWYFTQNKSLLGSPILTSAFITFKFHLGSIALGSLIITIITIIRSILRSLARNPRLKLFIDCCMGYLEQFLRFLTKNSFIITAMHGTSFYQSGKRAAKLIALNICNTIVINSIGDFVLAMAQVLVICVSLLFCLLLFIYDDSPYVGICYFVVGIISAIICYTVFSLFETAVDTMFLCFCEDSLLNDGINRPYAMPRGLMEFVQDSKKTFAEQIEKKKLPVI